MISFLHFQYFLCHPCSSKQCSRLLHSNIVCYPYLSNPPIKYFLTLSRAPITTGKTSIIFSFHNLPSYSSSTGTFPHFPFFFSYSYISWYSSIDYYPLLLFLVNYNYVWSSYLYHVVTLNIDIPLHFYLFIFYSSFWDVFIRLFYVLTIFLKKVLMDFLCFIAASYLILFLSQFLTSTY